MRARAHEKPSDYLCDGDSADDKEVSDAVDADDDIVEDLGFSGSRNARGQVRFVQTSAPSPYKDYFDKHDKYSDSIANGDKDDDKEIQKENDPHDDIVEDWGFRGKRAHTHL